MSEPYHTSPKRRGHTQRRWWHSHCNDHVEIVPRTCRLVFGTPSLLCTRYNTTGKISFDIRIVRGGVVCLYLESCIHGHGLGEGETFVSNVKKREKKVENNKLISESMNTMKRSTGPSNEMKCQNNQNNVRKISTCVSV